MVLKPDLQRLFPSNLDLAVGVLVFTVRVNDRRFSEACWQLLTHLNDNCALWEHSTPFSCVFFWLLSKLKTRSSHVSICAFHCGPAGREVEIHFLTEARHLWAMCCTHIALPDVNTFQKHVVRWVSWLHHLEGGSGWRTSGLELVAGWDVGQMVLRQDLQCLFPSNLDLAVGVLIFSVGVNYLRISEACWQLQIDLNDNNFVLWEYSTPFSCFLVVVETQDTNVSCKHMCFSPWTCRTRSWTLCEGAFLRRPAACGRCVAHTWAKDHPPYPP